MKTPISLSAVFTLLAAATAPAAIVQFDLVGTAGAGLLPGNEPSLAVPSTATGGEIGSGITFDDVSLQLTVNVGWGSSQGFADLTSASNNSHIHGPTTSANGAGFTQTAGVLFNLTRSSNLATGGTISQTVTLNSTQATDLQNGKFYINIHTASNGGGEMRGFIVPAVPEPGTAGLLGFGLLGLLSSRRRR